MAVAAEGVKDVSGEALGVDANDAWRSPRVRATADSTALRVSSPGATRPSKPRMRKCPQRVGKSASAILVTLAKGITAL